MSGDEAKVTQLVLILRRSEGLARLRRLAGEGEEAIVFGFPSTPGLNQISYWRERTRIVRDVFYLRPPRPRLRHSLPLRPYQNDENSEPPVYGAGPALSSRVKVRWYWSE
jgi:hypothetical protein